MSQVAIIGGLVLVLCSSLCMSSMLMLMGDDDTAKESKESKESKKAEDDEDDEDHEYVKEVKEIQGSISNSSGKTTTVKVHRIPTRL